MTTETHVEHPMHEQATDQHRWLRRFLGEWTYEGECAGGPEMPAMKFSGKERVRSVGDLWVVGESEGTTPDGKQATMILTVGFNPKTGRFVGSWIGSMMSYLWVYDGWLDESGTTLTLEAEGMCFKDPTKKRMYRDVTEFAEDGRRLFSSYMQGDDGEWAQMMQMTLHKVK